MDSSDQKVIRIAVVEEGRRCCVECRTTTTPMWRGGPTGPRSLCNACGIRYRKRRQELGLDNKQQQQQQQQQHHQDHSEATSTVKDSSSSRSSSSSKSSSLQVVKKKRVLMGVDEAAFLLMALSSSSAPTVLHG